MKLERVFLEDANAILKISNDKGVKDFFPLAYCENIDDAKVFVDLCLNSYNYNVFKILDEKEKIVGIIVGEKKEKKIMDVSYFIGKEYRRKGYCKQAVIQFAKYLKENTRYKYMRFCVRHNNKPSQKFLENKMKLKFEFRTKEYIFYKLSVEEF